MKKLHVFFVICCMFAASTSIAQVYRNLFYAQIYSRVGPGVYTSFNYRDATVVHYGRFDTILMCYTNSNCSGPALRPFTDSVNNADTKALNSPSSEKIGIKRRGDTLRIDARAFPGKELLYPNDTFYLSTKSLGVGGRNTYQIELLGRLDPALVKAGKFIDMYLNDTIDLASSFTGNFDYGAPDTGYGRIVHNFTVITTDAPGTASKAEDRFKFILSESSTFARFAFTSVGGIRNNDGLVLNWQGVNDESVTSYTVETMRNGEFVSLTKLSKTAKEFTDRFASTAQQVLRVKATFEDGTSMYSDTVTIRAKHPDRLEVYPNPVIGKTITLRFNELQLGQAEVVIVDMTGTIIFRQKIRANGTVQLRIPALKPQLHILKVYTAGNVLTELIMIQ